MVTVTRLDGTSYYINPHQIEYVERNPDLTLCMVSGKRLIVRESYDELFELIIAYRRSIGINAINQEE